MQDPLQSLTQTQRRWKSFCVSDCISRISQTKWCCCRRTGNPTIGSNESSRNGLWTRVWQHHNVPNLISKYKFISHQRYRCGFSNEVWAFDRVVCNHCCDVINKPQVFGRWKVMWCFSNGCFEMVSIIQEEMIWEINIQWIHRRKIGWWWRQRQCSTRDVHRARTRAPSMDERAFNLDHVTIVSDLFASIGLDLRRVKPTSSIGSNAFVVDLQRITRHFFLSSRSDCLGNLSCEQLGRDYPINHPTNPSIVAKRISYSIGNSWRDFNDNLFYS